MTKRCVLILAIGLMFFAFSSSCFADGAISVQWGDNPKPDCDDGGGKYKKKGGPPPHAPAHGYRAKHQYRYYPCCNVYHEPSSGMYFYVKGNGWAVGASLPTNLQSSLGAFVNLDLDTEKPYEHNAEHLQQYPKEKYKPAKMAKK